MSFANELLKALARGHHLQFEEPPAGSRQSAPAHLRPRNSARSEGEADGSLAGHLPLRDGRDRPPHGLARGMGGCSQ